MFTYKMVQYLYIKYKHDIYFNIKREIELLRPCIRSECRSPMVQHWYNRSNLKTMHLVLP